MAGSTPASASTDEAARAAWVEEAWVGEPARGGSTLRRFWRHPGGVVGLVMTAVVMFVGLLADRLAPGDPFAYAGPPLGSPSSRHPFGTDNLGRDLVRAVVHGLGTSATVALSVVVIAAAIGLAVGAVAGYRGGRLDDLLMRATELFQAVPRFFLVLLVLALFGQGTTNLVLVLALTSWPVLARVVRAETFSVREREFVEVARSIGASHTRVVVRHVLPNALPAAVAVLALLASRVVLLEASLSFLGLGDPGVMSLGFLVGNAQRFIRIAWWMSVFPGAVIGLAVVGINLLSDGLNDSLSPTR